MTVSVECEVNRCNRIAKRKSLIFLLIFALIYGFLSGILSEDSGIVTFLDFTYPPLFSIVLLCWCYLDSEERNFKISRTFSICIFLFSIFAFPFYIAKTRKKTVCFKTLAFAVLYLGLFYIVWFIGAICGSVIRS